MSSLVGLKGRPVNLTTKEGRPGNEAKRDYVSMHARERGRFTGQAQVIAHNT